MRHRHKQTKRPPIVRPSFFVWVLGPLAIYGLYLAFGLPHMIWQYRYLDNGTRDPLAYRYYTDCTFWGPYGMMDVPAQNGKCGYVRFFKKAG